MSRQPHFPTYPPKPHSTGQARIYLDRKPVYLGVHGSPESYAKYAELHADWKAGRLVAPGEASRDRTVKAVAARWMAHAEDRYRHSTELANFRELMRPLLRMFGSLPAAEFGPRRLKALQEAMATGSWRTLEELEALRKRSGRDGRWCRRQVNQMSTRCKTMFRWAESEELVPPGTYAALKTVTGIRAGQHGAKETAPVPPVSEADLAKTLPCLNPVAAAVAELLALTGARPSELLRLTLADINRTGEVEIARGVRIPLGAVWAIQPLKHKTAWRGHHRVILLGPRAQSILAPLLADRADDAPLFQPREGEARRQAARRQARKSKVQPSQRDRSRKDARQIGQVYTPSTLAQAVAYGAKKAGVPHWTPYMLRHLAATRLASEFGPEVARIVLGHRDLGVTRTYVIDDVQAAAKAMERAG